ncbi:hypothetical protein [Bacillus sp. P14.5]|uniref:hypothetical protein n=1 Tax=Bacillus sp. P14.5 TaxID=1983400 RepID=UPI0013B06BF7|nr:hypothetical protein [Bacillus sp. P14.5]
MPIKRLVLELVKDVLPRMKNCFVAGVRYAGRILIEWIGIRSLLFPRQEAAAE